MNTITSRVNIEGNAAAIFDLVTTTRFWTAWHPATTGVGGVTQRPFGLGDKIRERAQIGALVHEGTWTVAAHERPQRTVLCMEGSRLQITMTFNRRTRLCILPVPSNIIPRISPPVCPTRCCWKN